MTDTEFCRTYSAFYGEEIDNIKQLKRSCFDGELLKEFIEHCFEFNNVTLGSVSSCLEFAPKVHSSAYCTVCNEHKRDH